MTENLEKGKQDFSKELMDLTKEDVEKLQTIIVWLFQSNSDSEDIRYFIKNSVFTSNWREKIVGRLGSDSSLFHFFREEDSGVEISHDEKGLTYESMLKMIEEKNKLKKKYKPIVANF